MCSKSVQLNIPARHDLLVDPGSLPSPPAVALEILRRLSDEDRIDMREISSLVSQDLRLTTAIIRNANSAAAGASTKVTSIDLALSMMGARGLRTMVISTSMSTLMNIDKESQEFVTEARKRTLVCATLSRTFANEINPAVADEAFLVGLLGSLGHLVLRTVSRDVHDTLMSESAGWPSAAEEYDLLGYSTDEIAADLLVSWGMPDVLAEAVALRDAVHSAAAPRLANKDLVVALRLGLMAEKVLCSADSGQALFALLDQARGVLGLELVTLSDILVDAEPVVAEVAASVNFDIPEGVHADLVREATEAMNDLSS